MDTETKVVGGGIALLIIALFVGLFYMEGRKLDILEANGCAYHLVTQ